jgi:GGDEF domain-containing protein
VLSASRACATIDPLTGLANRAAFSTHAERDRKLAERLGRRWMLLLAEAFGRQHRDLALIETADHLRTLIGPTDLLARIDDSRFAITVFDTDALSIEAAWARLHENAGAHHISIGAAIFDPNAPSRSTACSNGPPSICALGTQSPPRLELVFSPWPWLLSTKLYYEISRTLAPRRPQRGAEVKTLTLREAIDLALKQNPDVILARLDQQKGPLSGHHCARPLRAQSLCGQRGGVHLWIPEFHRRKRARHRAGQDHHVLYNRPQSFQVAQANEALRATEIEVAAVRTKWCIASPSCFCKPSWPRAAWVTPGVKWTAWPA